MELLEGERGAAKFLKMLMTNGDVPRRRNAIDVDRANEPSTTTVQTLADDDVDGDDNVETSVNELQINDADAVVQHAMRYIQEDDFDSFKLLYLRNKHVILENCQSPENDANILVAALKNCKTVKIIDYLLNKCEIIDMIGLAKPKYDDVSRTLTVECLFALAESKNKTWIERIISSEFEKLHALHILGTCSCPLNVVCVHREVLSQYFTPLHVAVRVGDLQTVELLVAGENGKELMDAPCKTCGLTALHFAVCYIQCDIIHFILGKGARADTIIQANILDGYTPLAFAAALGLVGVVYQMLGASMVSDQVLGKELHAAAAGGNPEIVRKLFDYPECENCVNKEDSQGNTPLIVAARAGHVTVVQLILSHGASLRQVNRQYFSSMTLRDDVVAMSRTALHWAAEAGDIDVVKCIVEQTDVGEGNKSNRLTKELLTKTDNLGRTAIELSKTAETFEVLFQTAEKLQIIDDGIMSCGRRMTLLCCHCDVKNDESDPRLDKVLLFHAAAAVGHIRIVTELIDESAGKKFVSVKRNEKTALMLAAGAGHFDTVKLLLKRSERWMEKDNKGKTALHIAAEAGCAGVVQAILDHVIHTDEEKSRNSRCHMKFCGPRYPRLTQLITDDDKDNNKPFQLASNIDTFHAFINILDKVNISEQLGSLLLHAAAKEGYNTSINKIFKIIAKTEYINLLRGRIRGETALFAAVRCGHVEIVKLLLVEYYGRFLQKDEFDNTALHYATKLGQIDVMQAIFDTGIPCAILNKNKYGKTVFDEAHTIDAMDTILSYLDRVGSLSKYWTFALHSAVRLQDADLVDYVIKFAASHRSEKDKPLPIKNLDFRDFVSDVAQCSDRTIARKLMSLDPETSSAVNLNPLFIAACHKDSEVLCHFLEVNSTIDVDAMDYYGYTALMYCARNGNVTGCKMLLDHGADASKSSDDNKHVVFHILEEYGDRPFMHQKFSKVFDQIKDNKQLHQLTEINCNVPSRNIIKRKMNVVQLAAATGAFDIFKFYSDMHHAERLEKESSYHFHEIKECLKLIDKHCNGDEQVKMLGTESLRVFVDEFSRARRLILMIVLLIHISFMSCFSAYVVSTIDRVIPTRCNSTQNCTDVFEFSYNSTFGLFMLWPAMICFYELNCVIKYLGKVRCNCGTAKQKMCQDSSTVVTLYVNALKYDQIASHVSAIGFCAIVTTWFLLYRSLNCHIYSYYASVAMVALIYGWLQTLEYMRCFTALHAFCLLLKIVFVKDIVRIMSLYVFVLVGFGLAVYIYINTEPSLFVEHNLSLDNVLYQVLGTIFGQVDLLKDLSTNSESKYEVISPIFVRLLFAIYLLLSTVVLMNILIAMMNNSYDEVYGLHETLWCVDSLQSINWFWSDNHVPDDNRLTSDDIVTRKSVLRVLLGRLNCCSLCCFCSCRFKYVSMLLSTDRFIEALMTSIYSCFNTHNSRWERAGCFILFPFVLCVNFMNRDSISIMERDNVDRKKILDVRQPSRYQLTLLREEFSVHREDSKKLDEKVNKLLKLMSEKVDIRTVDVAVKYCEQ